MDKLNVLDLFSGIGGFSLGLEATGGFETKAFCELDKYCKSVLKKHWPDTRQYDDIKELTYDKLRSDGIDTIDIITGGYPCQPFSVAGKQKGTEDKRHLWPEYFRLVKECRPTWVIGENVSGHIKLGLDTVISDLESEDYAVRPFSISASSIGANHQRERVWIVANSGRSRGPWSELREENENETRKENANQFERSSSTSKSNVADANESDSREGQNTTDTNNQGWTTSETGRESIQSKDRETLSSNTGQSGSDVANTSGSRSEIRISEERYREEGNTKKFNNDSDRYRGWQRENNWAVEPDVGRVAYGVPKRVDRLKCLGNSLVPQIPYYIGKVILEVMSGKTN